MACSDASPGLGLATNHGLSDAFADESYYTTGTSARSNDAFFDAEVHMFLKRLSQAAKPNQFSSRLRSSHARAFTASMDLSLTV